MNKQMILLITIIAITVFISMPLVYGQDMSNNRTQLTPEQDRLVLQAKELNRTALKQTIENSDCLDANYELRASWVNVKNILSNSDLRFVYYGCVLAGHIK
jgi:hypothetical protein